LRRGVGNSDLLASLLRATYLTYFLLGPGDNYDDAGARIQAAEQALQACMKDHADKADWGLPEDSCPSIEFVLTLHDAQLARIPLYRIEEALRRLSRILAAGDFPTIRDIDTR
jgi:hypothetical protein